jgi:phosphatidylinositol glycan class W
MVAFLVGDLMLPRPPQFNTIFEAVNQNQLALFLLANLLTGLVNMTWQTLLMGEKETFLILTGYCVVLFFVASCLRKLNITIKLK